MLGHDHALSGALAFAVVAPLLPVSGTQLAVAAALTAGAGILPDLDEPGSTIARTFGFLTGGFAWIVHQLSGGHRKGTHSLLGVALMTVAALWAGSWQRSATAQHPVLWWHLVPAGLILALLLVRCQASSGARISLFPRRSSRPGGWSVAVQDLGPVLVPGRGGPVRIQHERPAPLVDDNLVVEPAQQHAVLDRGFPPLALCVVWCT